MTLLLAFCLGYACYALLAWRRPFGCNQFARRSHAQRRAADCRYVLTAILVRAETRRQSPVDSHVPLLVDAAWTLHKTLPGQEHWRCACAREEARGA